MRASFLLIAFLGALTMATPVPTENAAVVSTLKVVRDDPEPSNPDDAPDDDLLVADGF
ncbi:hypothetical protein BDV11DRAFT_168727 [Aspergillus similis]